MEVKVGRETPRRRKVEFGRFELLRKRIANINNSINASRLIQLIFAPRSIFVSFPSVITRNLHGRVKKFVRRLRFIPKNTLDIDNFNNRCLLLEGVKDEQSIIDIVKRIGRWSTMDRSIVINEKRFDWW